MAKRLLGLEIPEQTQCQAETKAGRLWLCLTSCSSSLGFQTGTKRCDINLVISLTLFSLSGSALVMLGPFPSTEGSWPGDVPHAQ